MVMAGPGWFFTEEWPGTVGASLFPASKLGRVTMLVLPPRTSTPGAAGDPVGAVPAPPGPGVGEIPARAFGSEPWPAPDFAAPEFSPVVFSGAFSVRPLPGPVPVPMPEPPLDPPRPGLLPPAGDRASDPLPPVPGMPGLEPGWVDNITPEFSGFPPAPLGGARTEPTSPGPPRPEPFLPEPERPEPEPAEGGGGIMLLARRPPLPAAPEFRMSVPELWPETDGGGGMTFDAPRCALWDRPWDDSPDDAPLPAPENDGGGGITFDAA